MVGDMTRKLKATASAPALVASCPVVASSVIGARWLLARASLVNEELSAGALR